MLQSFSFFPVILFRPDIGKIETLDQGLVDGNILFNGIPFDAGGAAFSLSCSLYIQIVGIIFRCR